MHTHALQTHAQTSACVRGRFTELREGTEDCRLCACVCVCASCTQEASLDQLLSATLLLQSEGQALVTAAELGFLMATSRCEHRPG